MNSCPPSPICTQMFQTCQPPMILTTPLDSKGCRIGCDYCDSADVPEPPSFDSCGVSIERCDKESPDCIQVFPCNNNDELVLAHFPYISCKENCVNVTLPDTMPDQNEEEQAQMSGNSGTSNGNEQCPSGCYWNYRMNKCWPDLIVGDTPTDCSSHGEEVIVETKTPPPSKGQKPPRRASPPPGPVPKRTPPPSPPASSPPSPFVTDEVAYTDCCSLDREKCAQYPDRCHFDPTSDKCISISSDGGPCNGHEDGQSNCETMIGAMTVTEKDSNGFKLEHTDKECHIHDGLLYHGMWAPTGYEIVDTVEWIDPDALPCAKQWAIAGDLVCYCPCDDDEVAKEPPRPYDPIAPSPKRVSPPPPRKDKKSPSPPRKFSPPSPREDKKSPSPPPPREDKKSPSPPPPREDKKSPSPPPPREDKKSPSPPPPREDKKSPSPPPPREDKKSPSPPPPREDKKSPSPPPPREDKKSPSPPPPREDKKSPSPPPPREDKKSPEPCPPSPDCPMVMQMCEGLFTPTDDNGCAVGCPSCPEVLPPMCPIFKCANPNCDDTVPAPIDEDGCPTGCPTCPTPSKDECRVDDEVFPNGWSGPSPYDSCNKCMCRKGDKLTCTRIACDAVVTPYPIDIVEDEIVSRVQRKGVKWSRDPVKNREIVTDAPKLTGILTDMSERITKLKDSSVNVLHVETMKVDLKYRKYSDKTLLNAFSECRSRPLVVECYVEKAVNISRRLMTETYLYDYEVSMESPNATIIANAVKEEVDGAEIIDRFNLTVTSDQVLLSGANDSEKVAFDALSDNSFNISDDDVFTFDTSISSDVFLVEEMSYNDEILAPAPPPPSSGDTPLINPYLIAGISATVALVAGIAMYLHKKPSIPTSYNEKLVSDEQQFMEQGNPAATPSGKQSTMLFSQNPLHA